MPTTSEKTHTASGWTIDSPLRLQLHQRVVIWAGLGAITFLAWLYLFRMPMAPEDLGVAGTRIAALMPLGWAQVWLTFMMWAVMMVAMMMPSAAPMITTYARVAQSRGGATRRTWIFTLGYIVVWAIFSAAATATQMGLRHLALIDNALSLAPIAGGVILIVAGIYQLTPFKEACLGGCRSPIGFLMTQWREGSGGAFKMGLRHGALCVGCCGMLMALLFVAGVMNLLWIAVISAFVLLEKAFPYGRGISKVAGVALIAMGIAVTLG
ncbi:MAG: DUF2182 domain-containing protein [Candidatus Binataceae bacterium]